VRGHRWYWSFFAANSVAGAASPLLPLYLYHLGGTAGDVGIMVSLASAVGVLASLVWGKLADRTQRRRPLVLVSFAGLALAYAAFPFIEHHTQLVYLNACVSAMWMASVTVSVLLIMESNPRVDWEREIGRFNVYNGLGWTLGLALGAVWTSVMLPLVDEGWGLRSLGAVIALIAVVAVLLAAFWLREPPVRLRGRSFRGLAVTAGNFLLERFRYAPAHLYHLLSPAQLVRFLQGRSALGPDLALWYYGALLAFSGFAMVFVPLPVFLRGPLGLRSEFVFLAYLSHHSASVLAFGWAQRAVAQWGHRTAVGFALFVRALVFGLWALVGTLLPSWTVFVLFPVFGITWAFFQLGSTAVVSRLSPSGLKGQSLGIYNALAGVGNVAGAITGGFLAELLSFQASFVAGAALVLLSLPILLVEGRPLPSDA